MLEAYVDAADGMAAIGEVAVWTFDLDLWGECTQAGSEVAALERFAARTGRDDLRVAERIAGPEQVFRRDLVPATEPEVDRTVELLRQHRATTVALLAAADPAALDAEDAGVEQPAWMPWRTPRAIAFHIADHAYLKRLGLPLRPPRDDVFDELDRAAAHTERVLHEMPRDVVSSYRGEVWTTVKVLRRLAWHERVEQVFLRRRLRAAARTS